MEIQDLFGIIGALLIIVAYLLLQLRRIAAENVWFSTSNAAGAALILLSLWFDFNLAAVIIETFWLLISLYGIGVALSAGPPAPDASGH